MNSYLIKGGGLMKASQDASLIKEVDSFISMFQKPTDQQSISTNMMS